MRDDIAPFEQRERDGKITLWLHGASTKPITVEEDKIQIILDAIAMRWNIDIEHAIIHGNLNIDSIAKQLDKDDEGRLIINGNVAICYSDVYSNTNFSSTRFNGYAYFTATNFKDYVFFNSTYFNGNMDFTNVTFSKGTNLTKAKYGNGKVPPYSFTSIGEAYRRSYLTGAGFFFEEAGNRYLSKNKYSCAADRFREARIEYDREGKYDEAGKMHIMEKKSIKKGATLGKKILYQIWETTCNYGESYWRFIGWMSFIILGFTIIYLPSNINYGNLAITFKEYPFYEGNSFLTALYFSVVTFATLGFGDITPVSNAGKLWVIFEVMCGYVMLGILITLVARKMTRS